MKGGEPPGPQCSFLGHLTGHGVTLTLSGLCRPFRPPVAPSALGWRCSGRARRAEQRGRDAGAEDRGRERKPEAAAPGPAQEGQSAAASMHLPRADAPGTKEGGLPLLRLTQKRTMGHLSR